MKYPQLVPDRVCTTPIEVKINGEGLTERGESPVVFRKELYCNYQEGAKTVLTDQKKLVEISGTALFNGDIAPDVPVISGGEVTVYGGTRRLLRGFKARNPDGTVNYTKLELI